MNDELDQMITDCENREHKLSAWEKEFIQSVREQFDRKGDLSLKQTGIVNEIWEKVTSSR